MSRANDATMKPDLEPCWVVACGHLANLTGARQGHYMSRYRKAVGWMAVLLVTAQAMTGAAGTSRSEETIVLIRHGEKPVDGLGQLNCQGLNRSLALPRVLLAKFGKPAFIFAPNPTRQVNDKGRPYDYVRPLATIEPTAIQLGLPVN